MLQPLGVLRMLLLLGVLRTHMIRSCCMQGLPPWLRGLLLLRMTQERHMQGLPRMTQEQRHMQGLQQASQQQGLHMTWQGLHMTSQGLHMTWQGLHMQVLLHMKLGQAQLQESMCRRMP